MLIRFSTFATALILLLTFSARQAQSCAQHRSGPREIAFLPGEGERVLNMQISDSTGVVEIAEDDSGFFGSFHMVNYLTTEISPNEKGEVNPAQYKEQLDFLRERTGKLYLDFSSVDGYPGRKDILASLKELNDIGKGLDAYKQEDISKAWRKFIDSLVNSGNVVTARFKKSATDVFGDAENLNMQQYYGVLRMRCGFRDKLNISQRQSTDRAGSRGSSN